MCNISSMCVSPVCLCLPPPAPSHMSEYNFIQPLLSRSTIWDRASQTHSPTQPCTDIRRVANIYIDNNNNNKFIHFYSLLPPTLLFSTYNTYIMNRLLPLQSVDRLINSRKPMCSLLCSICSLVIKHETRQER